MGSGIRARRRSNGLNEWAIYSLAYAIDESVSGTSGTFSLRSSYYKRAASAYTVDASTGQVSLTNSTQKTAANLAVGDYIVNISTSSSTATTGTKLYKITSKSGKTTVTFGYEAFTPSLIAKGTDTGERITSKNQDYPIDGKQGDNWYVMIAGSYLVYVWDVFQDDGYYSKISESNYRVDVPSGSTIYYRPDNYGTTAISLNKETGLFEYSNWSTTTGSPSDASDILFNHEWSLSASPTAEYYSSATNVSTKFAIVRYRYYSEYIGVKGESTGTIAESHDINAYPQDGAQNGYYYVFKRSYKKRI